MKKNLLYFLFACFCAFAICIGNVGKLTARADSTTQEQYNASAEISNVGENGARSIGDDMFHETNEFGDWQTPKAPTLPDVNYDGYLADAYTENGHWYCSELIWAAFYHQGINLDTGDVNFINEWEPVFPEEINAYSGLLDVVRYNYTTTVTGYTAIYHKVECNGNIFYEQHQYEEQSNGTLYCQGCDYTHSHTYFYMPDGNGRTHTKRCACGVQEVQNCVGFSQGFGKASCNICGQEINGGGISPMSEDSIERILLAKFE